MKKTIIPQNYQSVLSIYDTQKAIGLLKRYFEDNLSAALNLKRVSAPLFVNPTTGFNDNLNGVERPVTFTIPAANCEAEVVHSLAKWKRVALYKYHFYEGNGLYTDMNAIRRDEVPDNLHSVYVDQWDWEKVISKDDRTNAKLQYTVRAIVNAICDTHEKIKEKFPELTNTLSRDVRFISSEELLQKYPNCTPKEREYKAVKEYGTVFISQIGKILSNGEKHDGRAPDYDDWELNGDILFYNKVLDCPFEISSMGIRVNAESLDRQLKICNCEERKELLYHKMLLDGTLPQTIGGGIGQSRLCMLLLEKAHIGEVQSSIWDEETIESCKEGNIQLL